MKEKDEKKYPNALTVLSVLYNKDFIDERVLNNEILEWRKFRMNITERYL